jgi:murein DD-endopeptidase MepM/ murein hydrolase activator NlpD
VPPADLPLAAVDYDQIYANGLPLGIAMATSRFLESGNDYTATNARSTASGAYQVLDSAWNNYGGYRRAHLAPADVQDQYAYESFVAILKRNGDNLAAIPVSWYYPLALTHPELMDTVPAPAAGNRLTIREYQYLWLAKFFELLGEGGPPFLPRDADPLVPSIAFPVLGPVRFWHDFGAPRGANGDRAHEGLDLLGVAGQPLRAAFDGAVTRIAVDPRGISGVDITITRGDGLRSNYFHLNDDTPGTADGAAEPGLRVHPGLRVGDTVKAGQIIGYMGDTGNAVGLPHLHFELRTPEGTPIDPYPAVLAAQQREQCSVGIGPWSTDFTSPDEQRLLDAQFASLTRREQDVIRWVAARTPRPVVHTILVGPDGARWEIDSGGTVRASGTAALIQPGSGDCDVVPDPAMIYGTGAEGVGRTALPEDWWDVGVAYTGEVAGDDLAHGDGVTLGERPPELDVRHW